MDDESPQRAGEDQSLLAACREAIALAVDTVAPTELATRLCEVAARVLPVEGATLSMLFTPTMSVPVGLSDRSADEAERLQFTLGEGPCWQAMATRCVVVTDLGDEVDLTWQNWPVYTQQVLERTAYRAVASAPFVLASTSMALNLYAAAPWGQRWPEVATDALDLTRLVARVLRPGGDSGDERPADGLPVDAGAWMDSPSAMARGRVWLAESLVMDATGIGYETALDALRAHAFETGRDVEAVADDVIEARLGVEIVIGSLAQE